jgi:hypothetical protein
MSHESLIARLASDATPVEPLPEPRVRAARWLLAAILAVGVGVAVRGLRHNWAMAAADAWFLLSFVLVLATGVTAAFVALSLAVPGALRTERLKWAAPALLLAWGLVVAAELLLSTGPSRGAGWGAGCMWKTWGIAVGPAAVLLTMARVAAPLDWRWTGGLAALAALAFGVLGTELICPITGHAHIFTWHFLPVAVTTLATFLIVTVWTRR